MSVITLISDWGNKDYYVASVKGLILSLQPDVHIIDISHEVPAFKLYQASFILKSCYKNFPPGTINIIGINSEATIDTPHLVVQKDGYYFIGADNGIFSLLFDSPPDKIVEIKTKNVGEITFPGLYVFAPAACQLVSDKNIEKLGTVRNSIKEMFAFQPVVTANTIRGMIVYIDTYFNAITNITKKLFFEIAAGRQYKISFGSYTIDKISKNYNDVPEGEILALFTSVGFLEIAQNHGDAANQLGLSLDSMILIDFQKDDNILNIN